MINQAEKEDAMKAMLETRWIPNGARVAHELPGVAIVYYYESEDGKSLYAIAFHGRAVKCDWHYRYSKPEQRDRTAAEYMEGQRERQAWKDERKKEKTAAKQQAKELEKTAAGLGVHPVFLRARNSITSERGVAWIDTSEAAQLIRDQLKKRFPEVKFSVRSETYSGGSSVDVSWVDGPTAREVEEVACAYSTRGFDGMIDLSYDSTLWLYPDGSVSLAHCPGTSGSMGVVEESVGDPLQPRAVMIHGGAGYVMCQRSMSPAARLAAAYKVQKRFGADRVPVRINEKGELDENVRVELGNGFSEYLPALIHREESGYYSR